LLIQYKLGMFMKTKEIDYKKLTNEIKYYYQLPFLAQKQITIKDVRKNFNKLLKKLIEIEINLKNNFEKQKVLNNFHKEFKKGEILKNKENINMNFYDFFDRKYEDILSTIQKNTRNPSTYFFDSLKSHLKFLFNQLDYPFDYHTLQNNMTKFIFPNEQIFNKFNPNGLIITIKNSFNERWKDTVKELAPNYFGNNYLITDMEKLPTACFCEMTDNNITLVVFDEKKETRYKDEYYVISFDELVNLRIPVQDQIWRQYL